MGLDMYLFKTKKVSGVSPEKMAAAYKYLDAERYGYEDDLKEKVFLPPDKMSKLREIYNDSDGNPFEDAAYWRKAYDIHNWFSETFDGVENCKYYYVPKETLLNLLKFSADTMINNRDELEEFDLYNYREGIKSIADILYSTDFDNEYIYYYAWW